MTYLWACCRSMLLCWWADLVCMAREALEVADLLAMLLWYCEDVFGKYLSHPQQG